MKYAADKNQIADMAEAHQLSGMGFTELGFFDKGDFELKKALNYATSIEDSNQKSLRVGFIHTAIAVNLDRSKAPLEDVLANHEKAMMSFKKNR